MDFIFEPPSKLGDIIYGMSQTEVRQRLNAHYDEFQKSAYSKSTTDDFPTLGIHVFYDENRMVKGVELFRDTQVVVRGVPVIGRELGDVVKDLLAAGLQGECGDYGWKFLAKSLSIGTRDETNEDDDIVNSAYVALSASTS